jgi:toxin FitB
VYLVDTDVVSEMRKKERANRGVAAFFRSATENDVALYLSAVSIGELRRG